MFYFYYLKFKYSLIIYYFNFGYYNKNDLLCPLYPYKDLKNSSFGVPITTPLIRDEWEKFLDVSFQTNSKLCLYHFQKEDVVDIWESGVRFSKYTIS